MPIARGQSHRLRDEVKRFCEHVRGASCTQKCDCGQLDFAERCGKCSGMMSKTVSRQFVICNQRGLHARASHRLSAAARQFDAKIMIFKDGVRADATSLLDLLMLVAARGETITLEATGPDADIAVATLGTMVDDAFGEG